MNWQQTYRESIVYVGPMRGTLVYDNSLSPLDVAILGIAVMIQ